MRTEATGEEQVINHTVAGGGSVKKRTRKADSGGGARKIARLTRGLGQSGGPRAVGVSGLTVHRMVGGRYDWGDGQ